jgi:DNA-binding transcriptional LysR family regulator
VKFYQRARGLLHDWENTVREVRENDSLVQGHLRIAAPIGFGVRYLGPILAPLLHAHPGLEVSVDLDDRMVDLLGAGYDLGIRIGVHSSPSLIQKRLADIELWVAASPAYLKQQGTPVSREDLSQHVCVGYAHLTAGQVWNFLVSRGDGVESQRVSARFVANNSDLMLHAAEAGLGLVMLPDFLLAPALHSGRLVRVLKKEKVPPNPLNALFPKDRQRHPALRLIVDQLAASLRNPPWRSV